MKRMRSLFVGRCLLFGAVMAAVAALGTGCGMEARRCDAKGEVEVAHMKRLLIGSEEGGSERGGRPLSFHMPVPRKQQGIVELLMAMSPKTNAEGAKGTNPTSVDGGRGVGNQTKDHPHGREVPEARLASNEVLRYAGKRDE